MPITGNKRVSQLVELTSEEVQPNDLLLIIDSTARESKKIRISEFDAYIQGTGSVILHAISASYVPGSGVDGAVNNAINADSASTSLYSLLAELATSASFATTASFALNGGNSGSNTSASFLIYTGSPNGTASYAIKSLQSDVATAANFLNYFGGNNGTASYAMVTELTLRARNADTASYLNAAIASVATASYAFVAEVANSGNSTSSSFLVFSPNNGTASYAMAAQTFANVITDKGIFLANTQSSVQAQLDDVDILWSTLSPARTPIEAAGTIKIPYTASNVTSGTLYLSALDRNTGIDTVLDSTPIIFNVGPGMGAFGSNFSGSVQQTFTLMGQASLFGSYLVYVSASNNLQIVSSRTVRFNIASETDTFNTFPNAPLTFSAFPTSSLFTFSSTDGPLFTDTSAGIVATASLGKSIFTIQGINNGVVNINYLWKLTQLTASNFSDNIGLVSLSGAPNSLQYLSCSYCNLTKLYDFSHTGLSVLSCDNNQITSLPNFPQSMSYINCSSNQLTSLNLPVSLSFLDFSTNNVITMPSTMPVNMTTLFGNNNQVVNTPATLPDSIVSMSFNNNPLTNVPYLPSSSVYLSFAFTPLTILPTLPVSTSYISVQSASFPQSSVDFLTSNLVNNGQLSGTVDVRGNGPLSPTSTVNMAVLSSNAWTTLFDI